MFPDVSRLMSELKELTKDDPLADTLPTHGFHFTFLPLTLPLYNPHEQLPAKVEQLTRIWGEFHAKKIVIRHLRLVALPGQLLLAGIPESPAIALRQSFCEKVLNSQWKNELLMRHTGSSLPAPFTSYGNNFCKIRHTGLLTRLNARILNRIIRLSAITMMELKNWCMTRGRRSRTGRLSTILLNAPIGLPMINRASKTGIVAKI